jgi:cytochrome c oxidase subunit III
VSAPGGPVEPPPTAVARPSLPLPEKLRLPETWIDVSHLPHMDMGSGAPIWWGNLGMMVIEGTTFAVGIVAYLYLKTRETQWPPGRDEMPPLLWGSLTTAALVVIGGVARWVDFRVRDRRLPALRRGLFLVAAVGLVAAALRAGELAHLHFKWNSHAYGSAVWLLLVMHLLHVLTASVETTVTAAVLAIGPVQEKHLLDVRISCIYWYFVVLVWMPVYALVYLAARFL